MNKLEELQQKYPELYDKCWDFSIGPGWYDLIDALSELCWNEIQKFPKEERNFIVQVKEKFGSLRFYFNDSWDLPWAVAGAIMLAEMLSNKICSICGSKAEIKANDMGWFKALCKTCHGEK